MRLFYSLWIDTFYFWLLADIIHQLRRSHWNISKGMDFADDLLLLKVSFTFQQWWWMPVIQWIINWFLTHKMKPINWSYKLRTIQNSTSIKYLITKTSLSISCHVMTKTHNEKCLYKFHVLTTITLVPCYAWTSWFTLHACNYTKPRSSHKSACSHWGICL